MTNGYDAYPSHELLGQGVSASPETPVVKIISATYGAPFSFYVTRATYGANGQFYVVTDKVNSKITGNMLSIPSDSPGQYNYNMLFGDPIVGTVKTLTVTYISNGVSNTVTVGEHQDLNIVVTSTGTADVTPYFQHNLVGNTVTTTQTGSSNDWAWLNSYRADSTLGSSFADPSIGTVKTINVDYTVNGQAKHFATTPDVNGASLLITLN